MRVLCRRVPASPTCAASGTSPRVTAGSEYKVISILGEPKHQVQIQIVTDDGHLAWFDSTDFVSIPGFMSASWTARIEDDGVLEIAPTPWLGGIL